MRRPSPGGAFRYPFTLCIISICTVFIVINIKDNEDGWCPPLYDSYTCWNQTAPGTSAFVSCPAFFTSSAAWLGTEQHAAAMAERKCTGNGTWWVNHVGTKWANYSACFSHNFQSLQETIGQCWYIGYSISIATLILAIIIFTSTRALRNLRTKLHINLLLSFLLNAATQIVWSRVLSNGDTLNHNPVWCRLLHLLCSYSLIGNFMWMFCEGLFLHLLILQPYSQHRFSYFAVMGLGWGAPTIPVAVYAAFRQSCVRSETQRKFCWSHVVEEYWWILSVPAIFLLLMNLVFLISMIITVVQKTRGLSGTESSQMWKTGKAVFILTPILGVQYLLSSVYRPTGTNHSPTFIAAFQFLNTLITSLQGFAVALVLCFLNGEVQSVLKRRWQTCFLWQKLQHSLHRKPRSHSMLGGMQVTCVEEDVSPSSRLLDGTQPPPLHSPSSPVFATPPIQPSSLPSSPRVHYFPSNTAL